ncbi:MAG: hypothetical protein KA020_11585 [Planctomycetes bacterium]|nr:hypothetical protein [Planctomycetota bacterium]
MADLIYTIKAGTVNGTTEFNDIAAAWAYFKAGDRMGAGTATVAASSTLYIKCQNYVAFGSTSVVLDGILLTSNSTSFISVEADTGFAWNGSTSNVAGYSTSYAGFSFNSSAQLTNNGGQRNLTIKNLVIAGAGSTGNPILYLLGVSSTPIKVENCIIYDSGSSACAIRTDGFIELRNNVIIINASGSTSYGVIFNTFSDAATAEHNTVVCLGTATSSSGIFRNSSGHTFRNNYVGGFATNYAGTGVETLATGNSSSGTDAPGTSAIQSVALSTTNFESVTGSGDLRVKAASVLKTTGAARLSGVLTDAYGTSRDDPATVGAVEATAGGGSSFKAAWLPRNQSSIGSR